MLPNKQTIEEVKRSYNCDFNQREEFLTPSTTQVEDKSLLAFKQRLEEIVGRRDSSMASTINNLLRAASPKDRYFFAVGFGKNRILILI